MITIFLTILLGLIFSLGFGIWCNDNDYSLFGFLSFLIFGSNLIAAVVFCFASYEYIAAQYKADIINKEYGTKYTQEQIFYASDVIEEIKNIERNRIDLKVEQK